jgi:hypothetical protein
MRKASNFPRRSNAEVELHGARSSPKSRLPFLLEIRVCKLYACEDNVRGTFLYCEDPTVSTQAMDESHRRWSQCRIGRG